MVMNYNKQLIKKMIILLTISTLSLYLDTHAFASGRRFTQRQKENIQDILYGHIGGWSALSTISTSIGRAKTYDLLLRIHQSDLPLSTGLDVPDILCIIHQYHCKGDNTLFAKFINDYIKGKIFNKEVREIVKKTREVPEIVVKKVRKVPEKEVRKVPAKKNKPTTVSENDTVPDTSKPPSHHDRITIPIYKRIEFNFDEKHLPSPVKQDLPKTKNEKYKYLKDIITRIKHPDIYDNYSKLLSELNIAKNDLSIDNKGLAKNISRLPDEDEFNLRIKAEENRRADNEKKELIDFIIQQIEHEMKVLQSFGHLPYQSISLSYFLGHESSLELDALSLTSSTLETLIRKLRFNLKLNLDLFEARDIFTTIISQLTQLPAEEPSPYTPPFNLSSLFSSHHVPPSFNRIDPSLELPNQQSCKPYLVQPIPCNPLSFYQALGSSLHMEAPELLEKINEAIQTLLENDAVLTKQLEDKLEIVARPRKKIHEFFYVEIAETKFWGHTAFLPLIAWLFDLPIIITTNISWCGGIALYFKRNGATEIITDSNPTMEQRILKIHDEEHKLLVLEYNDNYWGIVQINPPSGKKHGKNDTENYLY